MNSRKRNVSSTDAVPKKKQKVSEPENKNRSNSKVAAKTKTKAQTALADAWRWSPTRRAVAVQQAVKHRLFDIRITSGKRDNKIKDTVADMNEMIDIDIYFILLTVEQYTKEIYKVQKKVIKIGLNDKAQMLTLSDEEQDLCKQLDESGHVTEAVKARMPANACLV